MILSSSRASEVEDWSGYQDAEHVESAVVEVCADSNTIILHLNDVMQYGSKSSITYSSNELLAAVHHAENLPACVSI